jgi:uncharacterized damage-inducible protein DinB
MVDNKNVIDMEIRELMLQELRNEVRLTEKFLKRIPEDKMDWRPHKKSMSIKELGSHLAEIPSWIAGTMNLDEMNMDGYKASQFNTVEEMVEDLRKNASEAESSLQKEDEVFLKNWKMKTNGETLWEMPRLDVLNTVVLNQIPHHRAQLGVYFRLLDISVPATYGPSADENE